MGLQNISQQKFNPLNDPKLFLCWFLFIYSFIPMLLFVSFLYFDESNAKGENKIARDTKRLCGEPVLSDCELKCTNTAVSCLFMAAWTVEVYFSSRNGLVSGESQEGNHRSCWCRGTFLKKHMATGKSKLSSLKLFSKWHWLIFFFLKKKKNPFSVGGYELWKLLELTSRQTHKTPVSSMGAWKPELLIASHKSLTPLFCHQVAGLHFCVGLMT